MTTDVKVSTTMTQTMKAQCEWQGYQAFTSGARPVDCPYVDEARRRTWWIRGFVAARTDREIGREQDTSS